MEPQRAQELLARERERIESELRALRADRGDGELSGMDQHNADAGTELFENERDQSLIERLKRELEAIDRAQQRLDDGTYGISVRAGSRSPTGAWRRSRGRTARPTSRLASRRAGADGSADQAQDDSSVNLLACRASLTAESRCRQAPGAGEPRAAIRPLGRIAEPQAHGVAQSLSARARQLTP